MKVCILMVFILILISFGTAQNGTWYQMNNAPENHRRGCAITWGGADTLYSLRGSNQTTFYGYIISKDSWITRASIPASLDTGGAIVYVRSCSLFAIRGKNSRAFYLYRPDHWFVRDSAPGGFHKGAALCWAGGDTIYAFRGGNSFDFYKYSISQNSWNPVAGVLPIRANEGAGMAWDGGNYIYAIFGGQSIQFYRYHIANRNWQEIIPNANIRWREGASLVWDGDKRIYALVGGNRDTMLCYNTQNSKWDTVKMDIKVGGIMEGVGLLAWDNRPSQRQLYLIKGYNTKIFYRYCLPLYYEKHHFTEDFEKIQFPPAGWQAKALDSDSNWRRVIPPPEIPSPPTTPAVAGFTYSTNARKSARLMTPKFYLGSRPALAKVQFYMYNTAPSYPGNDTLIVEYYKPPYTSPIQVASFRRYDESAPQNWVRREVLFVCTETDTMLISFHGISRDQYSIYIDSVAITIDTTGLYSTTPLATASNQSHLLARKPEVQRLHTVFRTAILDTMGAPTGRALLYYTYSDDYGNRLRWSPPVLIDTTLSNDGAWPWPSSRSSISTGVFDGNEPWIVYVKYTGRICAALQRQNGTWKKIPNLHPANNARSVSMAMGLTQGAGAPERQPDLAYVVIRNSTINELNDSIYFFAFDTTGQRYADAVLATGEILWDPSIAITPADYLHIAYTGYVGNYRIYYRTTPPGFPTDNYLTRTQPIVWSDTFRVSLYTGYPTEPAYQPSVEAYGASVYVAWRGSWEIWRRERDVSNSYDEWNRPRNMSQSPNLASRYQVMSTSEVTAFVEGVTIISQNQEIYANFWDDYIVNISQTDNYSCFPHIDAEVPEFHQEPPYALPVNTIWTERLADSVYKVEFLRYVYPAEKQLEYYTIETGDSIQSPMCLSRDGFIPYPQLPIDFGNQTVKYELPYLHPCYHHKIKAVVYQRAGNRFRQNFTIDSIPLGSVEYEPNIAETIEIVIPKQTYQTDSRAILDITKNRGQFVTLAKPLIVYQYEIPEAVNNTGPQSSGQITILTKPKLYQNYPNPFKSHTTIRYSLPTESKVSLSIYDVSGRLVKTLVDQHQLGGVYSIKWNGKDNLGTNVSSGIYFYRLITDNYQTTKRAIIIR